MTIILVEQEYKSIESRHNYRIRTEITYGGRETSMEIGKSKDNYNKDKKPRCFNCDIYGYMAKDCRKLKKEKEMRKCYKYNKVEYLAKDYKTEQKMKNRNI